MKLKKKYMNQIIDYLGSFDLPGQDSNERKQYLNHSLDRFLKTYELIPENINEKSKVLELGGSPYFFSIMIKKNTGCQLECANYFGESWNGRKKDVLTSKKYNEEHIFNFKHFNIEKDKFPYPDSSFDLVFFCEIIEHLTIDPVHSLVQINRILKKGGHIVITTPNSLRYDNILKLIRGKNVFDHYSGYGAYGRHNREYTPAECRMLVESLGYRIVKLYTKAVGTVNIKGFSIKKFRKLIQLFTTKNRGGNIFLIAEKVEDSDYTYPQWLFESMHEYIKNKKSK